VEPVIECLKKKSHCLSKLSSFALIIVEEIEEKEKENSKFILYCFAVRLNPFLLVDPRRHYLVVPNNHVKTVKDLRPGEADYALGKQST